MNKIILGIGCSVVGFAAGALAGYFLRKKQEIQIEEITEEELNDMAQRDLSVMQEDYEPNSFPEMSRPVESDKVKQIDTQKQQYWAKWKDGVYDTRSTDIKDGEEPVVTKEEEEKEKVPFEPEDDVKDEDLKLKGEDKQEVVKTDEDEYNYWRSFKQGEYDTMTIGWFAGDDITVDEDTFPITNPMKFLGFNPKDEFAKTKEHSLYFKNNFYKIVYEVVRYDSSYSTKMEREEFGEDDTD